MGGTHLADVLVPSVPVPISLFAGILQARGLRETLLAVPGTHAAVPRGCQLLRV